MTGVYPRIQFGAKEVPWLHINTCMKLLQCGGGEIRTCFPAATLSKLQGRSQAEAEEAAASSDFGPACVRNDELII